MGGEVIDKSIVQMDFNNSGFNSNVEDSMSILDKLKGKLDFSGVKDSLGTLAQYSDGVSFDGLSSAVTSLTDKFSTLGIVGITALQNITNRAIDAGINLVKSLTIDNIDMGFTKYQESLSSIQTMIAALPDVSTEEIEAQLDRIRWYCDETSYDYLAMVQNMSSFISSGVDIKTAADSIMGVANLAGLAGVEASKATHAFTGFAKAVGSGKMDQNSWQWIHTAGLDTAATKEQFIQAGLACGTLTEVLTDTGKAYETLNKDGKKVTFTLASFNSQLSAGWLNSDVMSTAFTNLSTYSGFMYQFQNALMEVTGEEVSCSDAMESLSETTVKSLTASSPQVKAYIKMMKDNYDTTLTAAEALEQLQNLEFGVAKTAFEAGQKYRTFNDAISATKVAVISAWSGIFEYIFGNVEEAEETWTRLGGWMWDMFAAPFSNLESLVGKWNEAGGRTTLIEALANIGIAFQNVTNTIKDAFGKIFPSLTADNLLNITNALFAFSERIKTATTENETFSKIMEGVFAAIDIGIELVKAIADVFSVFGVSVDGAGSSIIGIATNLAEWVIALRDSIKENDTFVKSLAGVKEALQPFADFLADFISNAQVSFAEGGGGLSGVFSIILDTFDDFLRAVNESIKRATGIDLSEFTEKVITTVQEFRNWISDNLDKIQEKFDNFSFGSFPDVLTTIGEKIKIVIDKFSDFNKAIGDFVSSVSEWSIVTDFWDGLCKIIETVWKVVKELAETLTSGLSGGDASFLDVILTIVKTFAAIELAKIATDIKFAIDSVGGAIAAYTWSQEAGGLLEVAEALGIMAVSLALIASVDSEKLASSIAAIGALFAELAIAFNAMYGIDYDTSGGVLKTIGGAIKSFQQATAFSSIATGLLTMSGAILVLASALKVISTIEPDQLTSCVLVLTALLGELIGYVKLLKDDSIMKGTASLISLATAMTVMSAALKILSGIEPEAMLLGIGALGLMLEGLILFVQQTDGSGGLSLVATGAGLMEIAVALTMLSGAVAIFGSMELPTLVQGLSAMAIALGALGLALYAMPLGVHVFAVGAGLILVSAALLVLAPALALFGDLEHPIQSLLVLAGALAILAIGLDAMLIALPGAAALAVAAAGIMLMVPSLIALGNLDAAQVATSLITLAAALGIFLGVSALATAVIPGIIALSAGILVLNAAFLLFGAAVALVGVGFAAFVNGLQVLMTLGPNVLDTFITVFTESLEAIAAAIPTILKSIGEGLVQIAVIVGDNAPTIIEAIFKLLDELIKTLYTYLPEIVSLALETLSQLLQALIEYTPTIVEEVMTLLLELLDKIIEYIPEFIQKGVDIILALMQGLSDSTQILIEKGMTIILEFINGLADSIRTNTPLMIDAMNNLMDAVIDAIIAYWVNFVEQGAKLIEKIIEGISSTIKTVVDTAGTIVEKILTTIDESRKKFYEIGEQIIVGLVDGILDKLEAVKDTVKNAAGKVVDWFEEVFDINSPSRVMRTDGSYLLEGLALGIQDGTITAEDAANASANKVVKVFKSMDSQIQSLLDFDPVITPRIDLSEVINGAKRIGGLFDDANVAVNGSANQNGSGSGATQYNFTQNNYSPKALSRIELYRQTNNQFALAREAIKA